jgi:hypothetical protein
LPIKTKQDGYSYSKLTKNCKRIVIVFEISEIVTGKNANLKHPGKQR